MQLSKVYVTQLFFLKFIFVKIVHVYLTCLTVFMGLFPGGGLTPTGCPLGISAINQFYGKCD